MAEQTTTPAEAQSRPDPNEKLVKIFDSEQESEAMVVKGLLDSAGIESDLASASLLQDAFPGMGGMIITVREEDAQKARELIAQSQAANPVDEARIGRGQLVSAKEDDEGGVAGVGELLLDDPLGGVRLDPFRGAGAEPPAAQQHQHAGDHDQHADDDDQP